MSCGILDSLWNWFAEKSLGPLLGVFIGFLLTIFVQRLRDLKLKKEHITELRREIDDAEATLKKPDVHLVHNDEWLSVVNSGDLRLFSSKERERLARVYAGFSNYIYEAKNVVRLRDEVNLRVGTETYEQARIAHGYDQ